jgi:hypothetical protein
MPGGAWFLRTGTADDRRLGPVLPGRYALNVDGAFSIRIDATRGSPSVDLDLAELQPLTIVIDGSDAPFVSALTLQATAGPFRGATFSADLAGPGRFTLRAPRTRALARVDVATADALGGARAWITVVDLRDAKAEITIARPPGVIELPLPAVLLPARKPALWFTEVDGVDLSDGLWPVVNDLGPDGTLRYRGIPRGARLVLIGADAEGRVIDRRLTYEGPEPLGLARL